MASPNAGRRPRADAAYGAPRRRATPSSRRFCLPHARGDAAAASSGTAATSSTLGGPSSMIAARCSVSWWNVQSALGGTFHQALSLLILPLLIATSSAFYRHIIARASSAPDLIGHKKCAAARCGPRRVAHGKRDSFPRGRARCLPGADRRAPRDVRGWQRGRWRCW
jgi:hypothetical protein